MTVIPAVYVADTEIQPEGRCISVEFRENGRIKMTGAEKISPNTFEISLRNINSKDYLAQLNKKI